MIDRFDDLNDLPYYASEDVDPNEELLDVCPTIEQTVETVDLLGDQMLSATLPINAAQGFELFCDVEAIPRWVPLIRSVRVMSWNGGGRPEQVAFLAQVDKATVGYTLNYSYDERRFEASWASLPGAVTRVMGKARFSPLGERACLMEYQLTIELPPGTYPSWGDPYFDGHAASSVINDFREHIDRSTR